MFLSLVHFSFCLEPKAYFQYLYFVNLTRGGGGGRIPDPSPLRSTHVISSFFKVCKLYTKKKCTLFEKNVSMLASLFVYLSLLQFVHRGAESAHGERRTNTSTGVMLAAPFAPEAESRPAPPPQPFRSKTEVYS